MSAAVPAPSRPKLSKLTSAERATFFRQSRKKFTDKSTLKSAFGSRSVRSSSGNPSQAALASLQTVPRPADDPLWTQSPAAGAETTSYNISSYSQDLLFAVGDISVSFNNFPNNPGWYDSDVSSNSNVHFSSFKLAQMQAFLSADDWDGELSIPTIQNFTGLIYGTLNTSTSRYFNHVRVIPLVLDDSGVAKTWRLEIDRLFAGGTGLAVKFIIEQKEYQTYSEVKISCLQTQAELDYSNDEDGSELQFAALLPSYEDDIVSTATIGNYQGSGGVVTIYDDDAGIYNWTGFFIYNTDTTVSDSTITGQTVSWCIPKSYEPTAVAADTVVTTDKKKITFGFDIVTLVFMVLMIVLVVAAVYTINYILTRKPMAVTTTG